VELVIELLQPGSRREARCEGGGELRIGAAGCAGCDLVIADLPGSGLLGRIGVEGGGWLWRSVERGQGGRAVRINGVEVWESRLRTGDEIRIPGSSCRLLVRRATEPLLEESPTVLLVLDARTTELAVLDCGRAGLRVLRGPRAGSRFPLEERVVALGSAAPAQVVLPHPLVEGRHALIAQVDGQWEIRDEGSRYGTFVNGRLVESAALEHGDVIQVGSTKLRFELEGYREGEAGGAVAEVGESSGGSAEAAGASAASVAEGADGSVGEVLRLPQVIAHEIRNYLGVLGESAEELEAAAAGPTVERNLARIRVARECIAELLPMLRLAAAPLVRAPMVLDDLVVEQAALLESRMSAAGISCELDLAAGCSFAADRRRLGHVVFNLMKNAIEAMPEGGRLRVSTRVDGDEVELEVADTGVGMAPEVAARVFEPLFTTKPAGSGLGLYLVRDVVRRHGGTIAVDSAVGEGARFVVRLPRRGEGG
jgi:signal transduction histidine kinase